MAASVEPYTFLALGLLAFVAYRFLRRSSFWYLPGPKPDPVFGNALQILNGNNVDLMLEWRKEYGPVFRYKALFGKDKLVVSDAKALKHVLNSASYDFPKPRWLRSLIDAFSGPNLIWSEGDHHKRQRKVMSPAFGVRETRALFPVFKSHADKTANQWLNKFSDSKAGDSSVIDIHHYMSNATLNMISEAAFDFDIESEDTELAEMYINFTETVFPRSNALMTAVLDYIPTAAIRLMFKILPAKQIEFLKRHKSHTYKVAKELVNKRAMELLDKNAQKDVFSLLVKANASENDKAKLSEEELLAQMSIIFLAGHETTASTLTWTLWELASHPAIQQKLRKEIRDTQAKSGSSNLTLTDIESMSYLQAVLKETLRTHPVVFQSSRIAAKDSIIPLDTTIHTTSGEAMQQLHVPKGTEIIIAIGCYHRDKNVWGEDADEFNPERWLQSEQAAKGTTSIGVVGNLMTFLSGTRSCIGWRFAMLEMQCFVAELINHFEFRVEDPTKTVRSWGDNSVYPLVDGEEDKGPQMPLRVSLASRD